MDACTQRSMARSNQLVEKNSPLGGQRPGMSGIRDITRFPDRVYLEIGREYGVENDFSGIACVHLVGSNKNYQPIYWVAPDMVIRKSGQFGKLCNCVLHGGKVVRRRFMAEWNVLELLRI